MSPIGFGNTFGIASEFTNEIYDISNDANQAAVKEGGDTWTMVLGIVVTLLPKVHCYHSLVKYFEFSISNALIYDSKSCNELFLISIENLIFLLAYFRSFLVLCRLS